MVAMNQESAFRFRQLAVRLTVTALALGVWFWTQAQIGHRALHASGIGDGLLVATAPLNLYLAAHPRSANALLIVSSGLIDLMAIFLLGRWIFGPTVRPFLGLVMLMALRQAMQALVALPAPDNVIWHDPGFPSLLVTYGVANDYFFSGHTAIAVFAATELARFKKAWLTALAVLVVILEIATVLALRAHYTMDVFTGIVTALLVTYLVNSLAPPADRYFARTSD
jgi:hypothetical protein